MCPKLGGYNEKSNRDKTAQRPTSSQFVSQKELLWHTPDVAEHEQFQQTFSFIMQLLHN